MKDNYGRDITYMRISVTDRCNLRCKYCMPEEGFTQKSAHNEILTFEDIERIVRNAAKLGIGKFRLTGGEPLARKDIVKLVSHISKIEGVKELAMTTNGILLKELAQPLKDAGLDRVNISLDTMDPDKYREITRGGDLNRVLEGIAAAEAAGLTPIKLNVVALGGFNDDELEDFAKLTYEKPYSVRFIELMPIGHADVGENYGFISNQSLLQRMSTLEPVESNGSVADLYRFPGAKGTVGFISALSNHFCETCNKVRLTPDGKIKPCLHSNEEIDLTEALKSQTDDNLRNVLSKSVLRKEERHHLNEGAAPIDRDMNRIGG